MAKFAVRYFDKNGLTGSVSFDVVAAGMTAEDKLAICRAGADVLIRRLREFLTANTHDPNAAVRGRLAESLTAREYPATGSIIVSPRGTHHGRRARRTRAEGYRRAKTGQGRGRTNKSSHHGMSSATSAMDVGYYLEYGTPRMAPLHWMETVAEQFADEVQAAMEAAWDAYLTQRGF